MRLKISLIAFVICFLSKAQITINKDGEPKYTLDINGSMRIGETPDQTPETVPLAWNPETGQVILGKSNGETSERRYYHRRYMIKMSNIRNLEVSNIKLGINPERYTAVLINSNLVTQDFSWDNPRAGGAIVSGILENSETGDRKLAKINGNKFDNNAEGYSVGYVLPKLSLTNDGQDYLFTAYFSDTEGAQAKKYMWIIDLLISNKF